MKLVKTTITAAILAASTSANAVFNFSDISYTQNSITFTIDGDMTGYSIPAGLYIDQFSISFYGDFFNLNSGYFPNTWSASVFDNKTIKKSGNTGSWNEDYAWSKYNDSLTNAVATNRTVTLSTTSNVFDLNGKAEIGFNWGSPNQGPTYFTELGRFTIAPVPEPSTYALMIGGLGLVGLMAARRKQA